MAQAGIERWGSSISPREPGSEIPQPQRGTGGSRSASFTYIVQDERSAGPRRPDRRPFLGDSPFVMYLGDNLLQGGIEDLVAAFPPRPHPTR